MEDNHHGQGWTSNRGRTSSPPRSVISSKLTRSLSPTRVFADDQKYKPALPDLFKQKGSLQLLHSLYLQETSNNGMFLEQHRYPKLLARMEDLLESKIAEIDAKPTAQQGWASMQLLLDAHRQVFDAFLHSFTTYRPLLARVRREYDLSLDDALAAVHDNIFMRGSLTRVQHLMEKAVQEAQEHARGRAKANRIEVQQQLAMIKHQTEEAERHFHDAEAELLQLRARMDSAKKEIHQLASDNSELRKQLALNSSASLLRAMKS